MTCGADPGADAVMSYCCTSCPTEPAMATPGVSPLSLAAQCAKCTLDEVMAASRSPCSEVLLGGKFLSGRLCE